MNAAEANKQSEAVREANKKAREIAETARHRAAVKKAKENHEIFLKEFNEDTDRDIAEAVKKGKKHTVLYLGNADQLSKAKDLFTDHVYIEDIKKTVARLRRNGFSVTNFVETKEDYYEAGETYSYYVANLKVSW